MPQISQRIYFLLKLFLVHFFFFVAFRIVFYFSFHSMAPTYNDDQLLKAFYLGTKFDMRLALVLVAPAFLLGALPFMNPLKKARKFWIYFYCTLFIGWLVMYAADLGHYGYLNSRVNASVLQYLLNPHISGGVVWDTYPVVRWLIGFGLGILFFKWILEKFVFSEFQYQNISRLNQTVSYVVLFFAFAGGLYGKVGWIGLRWSEAFFSQNYFISAMALNPILYFFDTYHYQVPEFDEAKVRKYYPIMADYLGVPKDQQDEKTLNFKREVVNTPKAITKPNVIVVVMESMATCKSNLSANPLETTPYLKQLANESYYFDQYYVPSQGTARSMFGITTSVPDVTSYETASRNPLINDQNAIMDYFDGYEKFYFLGGSANWAEIRSVFTNNVKGIHVVEEGQYDAPRTDVWGLSDLDLFKETFKKLSKIPSDQPFFAVIQSASFHRPYTIPQNKDDFEVKKLPDDVVHKAGFISLEEYNSIRFSDYSLGTFIKLLKASPFYKNTIIVVTGDHGLPDENAAHIPLARRITEIEKYHVPFILHNPVLFPEHKVDSRLVQETDVMATIADLAGVSYTNTGFGRDMFDPQFDKMNRVAFTFFHYIRPQPFGLIHDNFYYLVRGPREDLFSLDPAQTDVHDVSKEYPDKYNYMKEMTYAYLETAKYILYHNKNLRRAQAPKP